MEIQLNNPYAQEQLKAQVALMQVMDPELNINIVDMGLIYEVIFSTPGETLVRMTLSTPYCPMGHAIEQGVLNVLSDAFPDRTASIQLVWEPEWNFDRISDAGKEQLNML